MARTKWGVQRSSSFVAVACIAMTIIPHASSSQVLINELQPRGTEWVEVYNAGTQTVDLGDYIIRGETDFEPPPGTLLPPGDYLDLPIGPDVFSDLGGETSVIDRTSGDPDDTVSYGTRGSAPLPSTTTSLARAPDAAAGPVPPADPLTDGLVWTIAYAPTPGTANTAPDPELGLSIRINELQVLPPSGPDRIELFNPTSFTINISGWRMFVAGEGPITVPGGDIDPLETLVRTVPSGLQLEDSELVYLFDDGEVRVDQSGFGDGPPLEPGERFARFPDGSGSALGFDFATSELDVRPCSIGTPNEDPTPTESGTWGTLKARFR